MSVSRNIIFLPLPALLLAGCASAPNASTSAERSAPTELVEHAQQEIVNDAHPEQESQKLQSPDIRYAASSTLSDAEQTAYKTSLINSYQAWAGTPYRYMGDSMNGIDCSAFVRQVYSGALGVHLPRTTLSQVQLGEAVEKDDLQVGDLVFFRTGKNERHVGIFLGDDEFISATSSRGVAMSNLNHSYWKKNYWQSRRPIANDDVIKDLQQALKTRTDKINQEVEQIVVARVAQEKRAKAEREAQIRQEKAATVAAQKASQQKTSQANSQGSTFRQANVKACSLSVSWSEHTVKSGDSLGKIAKRFSSSVQQLKQDNHLNSDTIRVGQVLKVRHSYYPAEFEYKVKSGDTLSGIARTFHTSVKQIMDFNHLKSSAIRYHQRLKIPC